MKLKLPITSGSLMALAATFMLVTPTLADTPALTSAGFTTTQPASFTGTVGWLFNVFAPNSGIYITQLGVFDSSGVGLVNSHEVGVWSSDGTLLASATVPAGSLAPLYDGYRYVPITPVAIPRNFSEVSGFIIAVQYSAGDADNLVTPVSGGLAPGLFLWGATSYGAYGLGPGLPFPNQRTVAPMEGGVGAPLYEPNFQFVVAPEPSTALLILLGGGALLYVRRIFHR